MIGRLASTACLRGAGLGAIAGGMAFTIAIVALSGLSALTSLMFSYKLKWTTGRTSHDNISNWISNKVKQLQHAHTIVKRRLAKLKIRPSSHSSKHHLLRHFNHLPHWSRHLSITTERKHRPHLLNLTTKTTTVTPQHRLPQKMLNYKFYKTKLDLGTREIQISLKLGCKRTTFKPWNIKTQWDAEIDRLPFKYGAKSSCASNPAHGFLR
jgi:hypothetical protein